MSNEDTKNEIEKLRQNDITLLEPKQQRFIHLYLTGQFTLAKLGELLDVHPNTLRRWLKEPIVKSIITEYQRDEDYIVKTALKSLNLKAVNKLNDLVDSPIDGVSLQAVKDILDRNGYKPEQKVKKDVTVTSYEKQMENFIDNVIDLEKDEYNISE